MKNNKIIVVGQTPPPYGGQALMIEYMLQHTYSNIELLHVRMCFSKEMNQRGKISFYKITHLLSIILRIYKLKIKDNPNVLYYPPSNSPKVSIYRDVIILLFTRFLFKKTIFHFHAAGISEELPFLNPLLRKISYLCFSRPDFAITSSRYNPKDAEFLKAKNILILPLGIPDVAGNFLKKYNEKVLSILFVGLLNSTKGEEYILEAISILKNKGKNVLFQFAGKFENEKYKSYFFDKAKKLGVTENINYLGIITGNNKHEIFKASDIFCFPSFFVSESFGIVLLEAMQYQMPIIGSKWRGIQSIISENENGFLIDIKNSNQIANAIEFFIDNNEKLRIFGAESRRLFEEKFTLEKYLTKLEDVFITTINDTN